MKAYVFIFLTACVLLSGCANRFGNDALGAAAGGGAAYALSDGDPTATAIGAATGLVVSEVAQAGAKKDIKQKLDRAYERGASDATKRQYWIVQNLQKQKQGSEQQPVLKYYQFPAATNVNGVQYVPHDVAIPVQE